VGVVGQKKQRDAWFLTVGTYERMVFETSINNLTGPQTP